jgi:PAS domain S-box-containing protein
MGEVPKTNPADGEATQARLRQANRALLLFSRCNRAVVEATDELALLNEVCRIAVGSAGYRLAWVGRAEHDADRTVRVVAHAGPDEVFRRLRVSWGDDGYGQGAAGNAIRGRRTVVARHIDTDPKFAVWRQLLAQEGVNSATGIPMFVGSDVYGALLVYAPEPDAFDATEIGLLEELAATISNGMTALRAEKQRAESDREAARLLDRLRRSQTVAQIGSWELDLSAQSVWCSEETFRIYGLPLSPAQTLSVADVRRIALPDFVPILDQAVADLVGGTRAYDVEFSFRRPADGELRTVHSRAELARAADGRPTAIVGTIQDITSRKQLEEQLLQAQKMESVGHLAGGIAHDFNNMLTVIQSYGVFLANGVGPDPGLKMAVDEIQAAAQGAANLTRQLLAFSRKQILRPHVLNLNEIVASAERMLRRLIGEDVELLSVPAADLGHVRADRGQIEQVIVNLAVNARDAMARGGRLTIETRNVELTTAHAGGHVDVMPGAYVMLAMTDTGDGMDAATQRHIFEPFFTTKKEKGTGLGLSTVYGIVRQSGGHIWVYSEPGRGTTFKLHFPRVADGVPLSAAASHPPPTSTHGSETILVAEDNEQVRELVCGILSQAGYTVISAPIPTEALRLAAQHHGDIHLLLSDVVMPHLSGPELAERLAISHPTTKVLYMSGYTDNAIGHQGALDPRIAFLAKPLTPETLLAKVREVLDAE